MRTPTLVGLTLLGALSVSMPAMADMDAERTALARLVAALSQLEPLVREAEAQADPMAPIHLRYDLLRQDLATVQQALERHLEAPRRYPAPIEPLAGDYRDAP